MLSLYVVFSEQFSPSSLGAKVCFLLTWVAMEGSKLLLPNRSLEQSFFLELACNSSFDLWCWLCILQRDNKCLEEEGVWWCHGREKMEEMEVEGNRKWWLLLRRWWPNWGRKRKEIWSWSIWLSNDQLFSPPLVLGLADFLSGLGGQGLVSQWWRIAWKFIGHIMDFLCNIKIPTR